MLTTRLIPCLDIKEGRVVKGVQFIDLRDAGDPITVAKHYAKEGADELCFLDITASSEGRNIMRALVSQVAEEIFIPFTVGGGLRNLKDIDNVLHAGADKVSLNTAAFQNPDIISEAAEHFGSQCIICAIDARRNPSLSKENKKNKTGAQDRLDGPDNFGQFEVYLHGGRTPTARDAVQWAKEVTERGAGELLLTSMDRDGTGKGYDLELLRAVRENVSVPVIASGGVGKAEHLCEAVELAQADALLAASIFHFKEYSIPQVKAMMAERGLHVR